MAENIDPEKYNFWNFRRLWLGPWIRSKSHWWVYPVEVYPHT